MPPRHTTSSQLSTLPAGAGCVGVAPGVEPVGPGVGVDPVGLDGCAGTVLVIVTLSCTGVLMVTEGGGVGAAMVGLIGEQPLDAAGSGLSTLALVQKPTLLQPYPLFLSQSC